MVNLLDSSGCKTDLVPIRTIAMRRLTHQFLLREFPLHSVVDRYGRVSCSGHTHSLVDIGTPGQRISDCPAKTGSRASERLYFRRMIVSLILEVHKPLFLDAVYTDRHDDAAGIDLIRLFLVGKLPFLL